MSDPTCANCHFGIYIERTKPDSAVVVCQRMPPVPVLTNAEDFHPGDTIQGYWPRVSPDEHCGEHKPAA